MRRIWFLLIVLLVHAPILIKGQTVEFGVQPDGTFKNLEDGKEFVVIERSGKSQSDLYSEILIAITKLYNSPKDAISKVENEVISVNGLDDKGIMIQTPGMKLYFDVEYILQFQFKDEKIRVNAPIVTHMISRYEPQIYTESFTDWMSSWKLFVDDKPNPKKKREVTINDLNATLNSLINGIISSQTLQNNDDW